MIRRSCGSGQSSGDAVMDDERQLTPEAAARRELMLGELQAAMAARRLRRRLAPLCGAGAVVLGGVVLWALATALATGRSAQNGAPELAGTQAGPPSAGAEVSAGVTQPLAGRVELIGDRPGIQERLMVTGSPEGPGVELISDEQLLALAGRDGESYGIVIVDGRATLVSNR